MKIICYEKKWLLRYLKNVLFSVDRSKHQNRTQEDKDRASAKQKAKKYASDLPTYERVIANTPPQVAKQMANTMFSYSFTRNKPEVQKMIIEELNSMGVKIPTINE